jgi:hypothetical protein
MKSFLTSFGRSERGAAMTIATLQGATRTGLREFYVVQNGSDDFLTRRDNDDWWTPCVEDTAVLSETDAENLAAYCLTVCVALPAIACLQSTFVN